MTAPETGYGFVGFDNLRNDIYPAISAKDTPALHKQSIDVTSESAVANLAEQVQSGETRLDVLINNAGDSAPWVPLHESDPAKWWRTMEVNVKGPYLLAHAFLPLLLKTAEMTGNVDIINVSSIGALTVTEEVASAYGISKLAVYRLTEHLDVGYAAKGINAVSVHPGGVETTLAKRALDILKPYLIDTEDLCGGFAVWITAEPRKWLGGRYASATWYVDVLEKMKDDIVDGDKLKVKLAV
ncbi:uncharacterized protein EKO05_0010195 [Ascochyta rabiei]|uniref:uncharacterized protein n=1 Tax=Didymella rabiei TaxID=5454 RepID=UPI0018FF7F15|nr:uncharacterized protein EKO05_0010195 [Ascochyta rabiei]UPX19946.1 hypothetical protein EKO05_0010195 [Ascochyta rabiei]